MDGRSLEGLSREELIELVLRLRGEIEGLRERISEFEEKRAGLFFEPGVEHGSKRPGRRDGREGVARPLPEVIHGEKRLVLEQCPECGSRLKRVAVRTRVVEDIRLADTSINLQRQKVFQQQRNNTLKSGHKISQQNGQKLWHATHKF